MLKIETFEGGYDRNFDYLIYCPSTFRAALVDSCTPVHPIQQSIHNRGLVLEKILLTHTHSDHIEYLTEWVTQYPWIQIMGHREPVSSVLPNYLGLKDGAKIELGNSQLLLIATPGHYPDSVCWYDQQVGVLFTGDTVFIGRTGRTVDPLSDVHLLYRSVYQRILPLPKNTVIYPGHNYGWSPSLPLGEIETTSDFFSCKNAGQFVQVMAEFEATRQPGS
jgi:glyoxylase-like metal-dependent hydrolase (beta-lactamase superfamily II)